MSWPPVPSGVSPFPDVDEDSMESAGTHFITAHQDLTSAHQDMVSVAATATWRSPTARPSWDAAVSDRARDLSAAADVTQQAGHVLRKSAAMLRACRETYNAAAMWLFVNPDPTQPPYDPTLGGLLGVPPEKPAPPPDPTEVARWNAHVRSANDAVSDATYILAAAARELLTLSAGVTFAVPPPIQDPDPDTVIDPTTLAVLPLAPAIGAPQGAIYANGVPVQFPTGRRFESDILKDLGIGKEDKSFFRPSAQDADDYDLPFTKSGKLVRGTFPDSMKADLLEIKSGTSEVTMTPQLRIQEFIARQLGIRWNLIVDRDTPVSQEVMDAIAGRGGGVYRKIPGLPGLYQRVLRNGETENVRLSGVSGRGGVGLKVDPVTEEEQQRIGAAIRNLPGSHRLDEPPSAPEPPPAAEEPSSPLVPEEQFDDAWENVPVEPVEPGEPGLGGVRPGEEPFEELFEEIIP